MSSEISFVALDSVGMDIVLSMIGEDGIQIETARLGLITFNVKMLEELSSVMSNDRLDFKVNRNRLTEYLKSRNIRNSDMDVYVISAMTTKRSQGEHSEEGTNEIYHVNEADFLVFLLMNIEPQIRDHIHFIPPPELYTQSIVTIAVNESFATV